MTWVWGKFIYLFIFCLFMYAVSSSHIYVYETLRLHKHRITFLYNILFCFFLSLFYFHNTMWIKSICFMYFCLLLTFAKEKLLACMLFFSLLIIHEFLYLCTHRYFFGWIFFLVWGSKEIFFPLLVHEGHSLVRKINLKFFHTNFSLSFSQNIFFSGANHTTRL